MTVLVLSDDDVRELLDMESCIEAMEHVLAALARTSCRCRFARCSGRTPTGCSG